MKLFFLLFILFFNFEVLAIDTKAEQAIVIDYNTKEILFEKNSNFRIMPASITKIMTVYVVFDSLKNSNLSLEDNCFVSPKAFKMGGSRMFLEINEKVSIKDLLLGIIIQSGNDASIAIAECLSGTESDFAKLMNIYAKQIGMKNTNFVNSSGWPEDSHYSTVKDLAILSSSIIDHFPKMYELFKLKNFKHNGIKQPNRNRLLSNFEGADGLKTGFLRASGWGIAGTAIRNNRRIIVVINGCQSSRSRLNESSNLLNWAFTQTSEIKLLSKNQIIKNVDVWLGNKPTINLVVEKDVISILSFDQLKSIESKIEYEKPISAPIQAGEKIGFLYIDISGKTSLKVPLVADENINNVNSFFKLFVAIKYLIFGTSFDEI